MHICECWTDRRRVCKEKSYTSVFVLRSRELSAFSKCLNTNKQTIDQTDSSLGGTEPWCDVSIWSWTEQISLSPPAAAPVLSWHILFITCCNRIQHPHYSFSLIRRLLLISAFYTVRAKRDDFFSNLKFSFQVSYVYYVFIHISMMMYLFLICVYQTPRSISGS